MRAAGREEFPGKLEPKDGEDGPQLRPSGPRRRLTAY